MHGFSEVRSYREINRGIYVARVELWPAEGLPDIHLFPFSTMRELENFERWLDATILLVTNRY